MKQFLSALVIACLSISTVPAFSYDSNNTNEGKVYTSSKVDTSIPSWFAPSNNKDIAYWLKVLPYEEYRYHNQYLVLPDMGAVAPIIELDKNSEDYQTAIKGKKFDYNKYLVGGPTIYPGTASIGEKGNSFIFGHSNFWTKEAGNFKTIFRLLYNMQENDRVWVYKLVDGKRTFYEYTVTMSKKMKATDTFIMLPEKDLTTITISGCYPIGTAKERHVVRATLTSNIALDSLLNPPKKNTPAPKLKRSKTAKTVNNETIK